MLLGPGGLGRTERLGEVAGRGGVLPGLPDVGGEFGGQVVGKVVCQLVRKGEVGGIDEWALA